jgi:hypothetical protein
MYSNRGWSYSTSASPTTMSAYRRRRLPRLPQLPAIGPLPVAIVLVAGVAWYHFLFPGFTVRGAVVDATTGEPVSGARVWSARANMTTFSDGSFGLDAIKPPEVVGFDAPGYRGASTRVTVPFEPVVHRLEPVAVDIEAVDAESGQPLSATLVGARGVSSAANTRIRVAPVRVGQTFTVTADGFLPTETDYTGQDVLRVAMLPRLNGRVTDALTGKPIAAARVSLDDLVLNTDTDGAYQLKRRPRDGRLVVLAPGYRRVIVDLSQQPGLDFQLQPHPVRATYLTYFAVGGEEYRQDLYRMLDTTEVNAVVIDVKGDYGLLSYKSRVPLAEQIGANSAPTIQDVDALLNSLHQHGAYTIARIVVFKDDVLAHNGPRAGLDVGLKDRRTGSLWVDLEELAWVEPFQTAVWDYNTALAREAIERGFDEVQFDYIRFATDPSPDGSVNDIVYTRPMNEQNRVAALKGFLSQAHRAVNEAGGFLGMDTFGYTTWWDDDGGIGQDLVVLADELDYYCPMVYPSTFNAGLPGAIAYPEVVTRPYEVVYQSLKHVQQKLAGKRVVVRPWLQYFDDYPWATQFRYDAAQIEAQKKAVTDSTSMGWMLWNAGSLFRRGGLAPKS